MWIFSRYLVVHPLVRRLLVSRFLIALSLCCLLEYELLGLFVLVVRLELLHPVRWLCEVIDWTIFSFHACSLVQLQLLLVAAYGVLLCHQQHLLATCHGTWKQRIKQLLPLKICFFFVICCLCCFSSYFYAGFVDMLLPDVEGQQRLGWYFVLFNGLLCGAVYFLQEHLTSGCGVWQLPVLQFNHLMFYYPQREHLQQALAISCKATLASTVFLLPDVDFSCKCSLLWICAYLNVLLVLQLLSIKETFGKVMLRQLPLVVVESRTTSCNCLQEQQLPMAQVLDAECPFGFQLQVAKDFYYKMANTRDREFELLFEVKGIGPWTPKNWLQLRQVLIKRIKRFIKLNSKCAASNLELNEQPDSPFKNSCAAPNLGLNQEPYNPAKNSFEGLRNLALPEPANPLSHRYGYDPPICVPRPKPNNILLNLACLLRGLQQLYKNNLVAFPQPMNTLCEGESLLWLVKGLVCICVRSLQLKCNNVILKDMENIFGLLLEVEQLTRSYCNPTYGQQSCTDTMKLYKSISASINQLVFHFQPYLVLIIKNQQLLGSLRAKL